MLDEVCLVLFNEWTKEIHGGGAKGQGRRCNTGCDEIRASLPKDIVE